MSLADNLSSAMGNKGLQANDLSQLSGVPASRISEIVTGKTINPQLKTISKLALALGITVSELTGTLIPENARETKLVPLLGRVSAGFPQLVQEDILEYISMPDAPNNAYVLIVRGDSMSPEIKEGAYILFIQNGDFKNGDIVVVNNEWGETMCKRFRERDGKILLASDNPEYPAVEPNEHYRIIGKVIESWTRKRH